ncbi:MAG: DUF2637 domain-containing protein [Actinophytocola sp.]|nr:DUF2637 domain-containing protein [Actinophytocola sp.]
MSRSSQDVIRLLVTIVLGGIGAAAGFKHTHDWAVHHGQTGWLAWADAVVIEGIAVVAGFEIHRDHRLGRTRRLSFPMVVLVAGVCVQMAAQVALAEPSPAGWLLAAMPALGFLVVVKLLMRRTTGHDTAKTTADTASDDTPATPDRPASAVSTAPTSATPFPAEASSRVRLPREMTDRITTAVEAAKAEGREPTTADIRAAVKIPDELATRVLRELTSSNGHPVAH